MGPSDIETQATSHTPSPTEAPDAANNTASRTHWFGLSQVHHQHVGSLLGLLLLIAFLGTTTTVTAPVAPLTGSFDESIGLKIDPNSAPWWELTIIPGVGEVTARRIVAFRHENDDDGDGDGNVPFRRPADLQAVHGIGPKTSARLAPYLTFPDS